MANYTYTDHVGDGTTTTFPFSFVGAGVGYLKQEHVYVFVNGSEASFTFSGANQVTITPAPANLASVRVRRIMPKSLPFADFSRGNVFSQDLLNNSFLQSLYIYHEFLDGFLDEFPWKLQGDVEVLGQLQAAGLLLSGDLDLGGNTISNLANAINPQDAVPLSQVTDIAQLAQGANYVDEVQPLVPFLGMRWYKPSAATTYVYECTNDVCDWMEEPVQSAEGTLRDELGAVDSTVLVGGSSAAYLGTLSNDIVSVMKFIPKQLHAGIRAHNNEVDLTPYLTEAHNTGKLVDYPEGRFKFSKLIIPSGGIVGKYKNTVLDSTDTSSDNVITHLGQDPVGLLVNELGAYFRDFYLRVNNSNQKASGAGIFINSGASNENYTSYVGGVTIRNIPTCLRSTNASFMTIERNYFAFYKEFGIYLDNDYEAFGDNGDNIIANNSMFTNLGGFSIKYRTGGGRIIGNKINGGLLGIDISPLRDSSIMLIEGNSIENQLINAVRFTTEGDAAATDYTQVLILGNQIGGYNLIGNAIQVNPTAYSLKNLQVCNNIILSPTGDTNAIDIRNTDRFIVANNTIDCMNTGFGGLFVSTNSTNGKLIDNEVYRFTTNHTQNLSSTTIEKRVVNKVETLYTVPSIAPASQQTLAITVAGCIVGDKVDVSMSIGNSGSILTGYVSATDTVTISWFNPTGSSINLGTVTVKTTVNK